MPLAGPASRTRLFDAAGEMMPTFSSDGRWLAYVSSQSARNEVYVRSSTGGGRTWQISNGGGVEPVWSASGRELFYRADDTMMVVDVELSDPPAFGKPDGSSRESSCSATRKGRNSTSRATAIVS